MQLVPFEATRYVAVITLTLVREAGDGQVRLFVAPLASVSAAVTGLVVLLAALAHLAEWLTFTAASWLDRLAGGGRRLVTCGQALSHQITVRLMLAGILGRACAWALLGL